MSNTRSPDCDSIQPRLAAFALGEAQPDADLSAHLAQCPTCQQDLRGYSQVARILPYAAPDAAPSADLRGRILAAASAGVAGSTVTTEPVRPRWRLPRRQWLAWGAACVALLALLAWNVSLQQQLQARSTQLARSRESWQTMTQLLNDPSVRSVALAGDSAHGHIWVAAGGDLGCLVVQGLPDPGADMVYQVWLRSNNQPVGVTTFEARSGNAWTFVRAQQSIATFEAIGVTIEPRGGSPVPTGPRVLFGELDALSHNQLSSLVGAAP